VYLCAFVPWWLFFARLHYPPAFDKIGTAKNETDVGAIIETISEKIGDHIIERRKKLAKTMI